VARISRVARDTARRTLSGSPAVPGGSETHGVINWSSVLPTLAPGVRSTFALLSVAAGLLWSLHLLLVSPGVVTQDSIAHFVISREAWHRPALMLHHWGRPVDTVVYMPGALFGLVYARLTSLGLAVLTVLFTVQLARLLGVSSAFVVPLLLWFQPWFLQLSAHASLTELPFTVLMVLSALLFVSGRFLLASVVVGLFPLIRVEALALTGLWVVVCALRRDWRAAALALLPLAAYMLVYQQVFGQLPGGQYPILPQIGALLARPSGPTPPNHGLLTMPRFLLAGAGLPVAALALYSLPLLIRGVPRLMVFGWYGAYLAIHLVLMFRPGYWAEQRYLFPVAPALAVAAALGLGKLIDEVRASVERLVKRRGPALGISYALLVVCSAVVLVVGLRTQTVPLDAEAVAAESAASWLRQAGLASGRIVATHAYVHYFLPGHLNPYRPGGDSENLYTFEPPRLSELPTGTIAVWDSHYSEDFGLRYSTFTSEPNQWKELKEFHVTIAGTFSNDDARIVIFQKERL
jgi:hypothetical protein